MPGPPCDLTQIKVSAVLAPPRDPGGICFWTRPSLRGSFLPFRVQPPPQPPGLGPRVCCLSGPPGNPGQPPCLGSPRLVTKSPLPCSGAADRSGEQDRDSFGACALPAVPNIWVSLNHVHWTLEGAGAGHRCRKRGVRVVLSLPLPGFLQGHTPLLAPQSCWSWRAGQCPSPSRRLQWPLPESQHPHPHFPIKGRRAALSSPDTCQVDHLHLLQASFRVGLCLGSADPLLHKQGLAQPNTLPN